jgi:hypothetical protein
MRDEAARRDRTLRCVEQLCPGTASMLSDDKVIDAVHVVLSSVMYSEPSYLTAIADCIENQLVSGELTARILAGLASHTTPTLTEGQVLIVSRRALRDSYERWWLQNAVFHHPKGASIVLVPQNHVASPPLRLAPFCTLRDAQEASELFASLAWGSVMPFEEAWRAAVALTATR